MTKKVLNVPAVEEEEYVLTREEEAEIDAAIEEADRYGGGISAEEMLRELRAIRDEELQRRKS